MKQLLQNLRDGKTIIEEVPVPQARKGTALVRVSVSLVSAGTERMLVEFAEKSLLGKAQARPDLARQVIEKVKREGILPTLEATFNRLDQPMSLGYSTSGIIIDTGEGMGDFKVGDRVACAGANHAVHADYNVIPKNLLAKVPKNVDFESAAFATLGAIAMHGFRLAHPQLGDSICVLGLGLLGQLTVKIALAAGCRVFGIDLNPVRVQRARINGAIAVTNRDAISAGNQFTTNRGFDAVLICADTPSDEPVNLAASLVRDRGSVISIGAVGMGLHRKPYFDKEIFFQVSRSYGPGRYDPSYEESGHDYPIGFVRWTEGRNLEAFLQLIASGKIEVRSLITHRFPIEKAPQAYHLITGKQKTDFLGVLLTYPFDKFNKSLKAIHLPMKERKPIAGKLHLGVLGAGLYANSTFLPAVRKTGLIEKTTIASASGASAVHSGKKYGFKNAAAADSAIIKDKKINVVAILTRHSLHARQVLECLKNGKHVYCEKPLAMNEKELMAIQKALTRKDAPLLMVGFNRRFAPFSIQLKEFLQNRSEPLVANYRVNAGFIPSNHWVQDLEQGGGRLIGEVCHFIDYLTFLTGELPITVYALSLPDNGKYRQDNLVLTLNYPDGSIGTVTYVANGDKSLPKEYLEVFCQGKVAMIKDFRSLELIQYGNRKSFSTRFKQDKGHQAAWKSFLTALNEGGEPPIPYDEIMGVHRATFSASQALVKQRVVEIPKY